MSWFAWTLLVYFWSNLLFGIKMIGNQYLYTKGDIVYYACITAFMTWAVVTQVG